MPVSETRDAWGALPGLHHVTVQHLYRHSSAAAALTAAAAVTTVYGQLLQLRSQDCLAATCIHTLRDFTSLGFGVFGLLQRANDEITSLE